MSVGDWLQTWLNVMASPGERAFEEERAKPQATLSTALIWVAVAAVITSILGWMAARFITGAMGSGFFDDMLAQSGLPPDLMDEMQSLTSLAALSPASGIMGVLASIVISIVGFLLFVGLLHLTARILGGTGNYGKYAYLIATFHAPLSVLSSLVNMVPLAGGCIAFIILIYELVLAYFATVVEHKLTGARAVVTILIPLILILVVLACVAATAASVIVSFLNAGR